MTDGSIGKAATTLGLAVCVAGIVLPFYTPVPVSISAVFGTVLLTLIVLWAKSD